MAIKIPSKNIYKIENPKIRDNVVDNVSIEKTVISPNNEYETSVYNQDISIKGKEPTKKENTDKFDATSYTTSAPSSGVYFRNLAYAYFNNVLGYHSGSITIKKPQKNKVISRLYNGKTEKDGKEVDKDIVQYSLYGKTIKKKINAKINVTEKVDDISIGEISYGVPSEEEGAITIQDLPKRVSASNGGVEAVVQGLSNESNYEIIDNKDDDTFTINYNFLTYMLFEEISGKDTVQHTGAFTSNKEGESVEAIGEEISITIYGNTIGIDLTDGSITYGSGSKPHSLSRNELLQDSGKVGETLLTEHLANNVLNGYAKGKETATLLCSISDYYDYDTNNLAISTKQVDLINYPITITLEKPSLSSKIGIKVNTPCPVDLIVKLKYERELTSGDNYIELTLPRNTLSIQKTLPFIFIKSGSVEVVSKQAKYSMSFRLHDEVIPMIFGANRQDVPMSKYQNGSPKVFEVVGSNMIYDGAVWQELTLLEK